MSRQSDSISSRYSDENQSIDMLNQLLKELQELSALVADYERRVSSLTIRSREIIPLKQRGQPVFSELKCRCLCIYKQPPVSTVKPVLSSHSKINKTNILTNATLMQVESIAECFSLEAFCNTFDLHQGIVGIENQFSVILRVAVLDRFYFKLLL